VGSSLSGEGTGRSDDGSEAGAAGGSDIASTGVAESDGEEVLASIPKKEIVFPRAPLGILFGNWKDEAVYIRAFISSPGPAEKTGLLKPGQAVLQVCGHAVPREATPGIVEEMILKVSIEARAHDDSSSSDEKAPSSSAKADRKPKYTLTVRDLELEQELMRTE